MKNNNETINLVYLLDLEFVVSDIVEFSFGSENPIEYNIVSKEKEVAQLYYKDIDLLVFLIVLKNISNR